MSARSDRPNLPDRPERSAGRYAALTALPAGYRLARRIELSSSALILWLNVAGLGLMLASFLLFALVAALLEALSPTQGLNPLLGITPLGMSALLLALLVLLLVAHELIHGLAFRLFGVRPRYGVNLAKGVAYASGENYYLARDAYQIVGLAPLVCLSLLAVIGMAFTSAETRAVIALIGAMNVGGSVGDIWFVRVIRRYPPHLLVRDFGEGAELFIPE